MIFTKKCAYCGGKIKVAHSDATYTWQASGLRRWVHVACAATEKQAKGAEKAARRDSPPADGGVSVAGELAQLELLRQQGVLTDEEFDVQKARLLGTP